MKNFFCIILITLLSSQTAGAGVPLVQTQGDSLYVIRMDSATMTIDVNGGKIRSFRYGDHEMLSQLPWPNAYGSTFWTSPQKEWYWPPVPEYDRLPYSVKQRKSSLVMTSQVPRTHQYRITKEFYVDPTDTAFVVSYTITNMSPVDVFSLMQTWKTLRLPV